MALRKISTLLVLALTPSPLVLWAQDAPPKIDAFEEAVPGATDSDNSRFRFTYPVRDAASERVYT